MYHTPDPAQQRQSMLVHYASKTKNGPWHLFTSDRKITIRI